jgi:alpha-glucosidase
MSLYLPEDTFYDFLTYAPIHGEGAIVNLPDVPYTSIPVYIKSGVVLPLRVNSANTTTMLRQQDFELVVAPTSSGTASGQLYIDDGVSVTQNKRTTEAVFKFAHGKLIAEGQFASSNWVSLVSFLGVTKVPSVVEVNGRPLSKNDIRYNATNSVLRVNGSIPLNGHGFFVSYS